MEINDNIRKQVGSWIDVLTPFIQSPAWDNIFKQLREISKVQKKVVIPMSQDVFKSLELCDRNRVKCVIVLQDPYPVIKEGKMVANGVPLDCSNTNYMQPSLFCWWEQVERSYSDTIDPDMWQKMDLSYLLEEEGVLLINSSWTTEDGKPGVHANIWEPFMKELFRILNTYYRGLPISLMGAQAQKYEKEINPLLHYIHKCEHPVMGSRNNRQWDCKDVFRWINNIIESNNGPEHKIRWYRKTNEVMDKDNAVLQDWLKGSKIDEDQVIGPLPWNKKE